MAFGISVLSRETVLHGFSSDSIALGVKCEFSLRGRDNCGAVARFHLASVGQVAERLQARECMPNHPHEPPTGPAENDDKMILTLGSNDF
ncbi:MAG: hypothetical protein CMN25_20085 [Salinicola sp.]|nr:hypothetical protein [Salinicola sp.]